MTVTATGTSGHASIPQPDNAVVHLAAAVQKIGTLETPLHLLTMTRRYFEQLAPVEDEEIAKWIRALDTSDRADLAALRLAADESGVELDAARHHRADGVEARAFAKMWFPRRLRPT